MERFKEVFDFLKTCKTICWCRFNIGHDWDCIVNCGPTKIDYQVDIYAIEKEYGLRRTQALMSSLAENHKVYTNRFDLGGSVYRMIFMVRSEEEFYKIMRDAEVLYAESSKQDI